MYEGWTIETYCRRASKEQLAHELKTRFNTDGYSFFENTYSMTITYEPTKQEIQVIFPEEHGSYQVILESRFLFGLRKRDERAHQELCKKTMQKIPWKKRGFWLQDGTRKPIPKIHNATPEIGYLRFLNILSPSISVTYSNPFRLSNLIPNPQHEPKTSPTHPCQARTANHLGIIADSKRKSMTRETETSPNTASVRAIRTST